MKFRSTKEIASGFPPLNPRLISGLCAQLTSPEWERRGHILGRSEWLSYLLVSEENQVEPWILPSECTEESSKGWSESGQKKKS